MVNGHYLSGGRPGFMQTLVRSVFVILAAIGGFFIFAASAAFALIVTGGLIIFGFVIFIAMWLRAKILGKPLNPYARMTPEQIFRAHQPQSQSDEVEGPVLDAHETPDGWSVDD
jgi:hypothetical protein